MTESLSQRTIPNKCLKTMNVFCEDFKPTETCFFSSFFSNFFCQKNNEKQFSKKLQAYNYNILSTNNFKEQNINDSIYKNQTPPDKLKTFKKLNNFNLQHNIVATAKNKAICQPSNNISISFFFWNSRSLNFPKPTLIRSRIENVIILNETWLRSDETIKIPGYRSITKNRENKIGKETKKGGGVAIIIQEDINFKVIESTIKETSL